MMVKSINFIQKKIKIWYNFIMVIKMEEYVKGIYTKEIFKTEQGYLVGLFKVKETNCEELKYYINKTITFTGYFASIVEDDTYILKGEVVDHPKYGLQYNVVEYERILPEDKDGIVEFLSSDLFKGVGPTLAKSIVDTLGRDTLEKILENRENLLLVPKMTIKKANTIYETLNEYEESHKTVVYLSELGFSLKDALMIYNLYKQHTIMNIEHNVYSLLDETDLPFSKIDSIRYKLNIENDDERRIKAGIYAAIKNLTYKTGDTYFSLDEIILEVSNLLKINIYTEDIVLYLDELRYQNKIKLEDNKYFLMEIYQAEVYVKDRIQVLLEKSKTTYKKINIYLEELEKENGIHYNIEQESAIKKALENNITIITGGPGTGKTTIIKGIVNLYSKLNKYDYEETVKHIALLSPTGRASKKMSEATTYPASTIHRFLKWNKDDNSFMVNEKNPDFSHLIIVDEVSMIDISLFSSLLKGLLPNIKLILVGDYNQLPSVGPGNLLKDLIDSNAIDTVSLEMIYRQSEDSYIPILAHDIKNNEVTEEFLEQKDDYTFLKCSKESIMSNLKNLSIKLVEKGYNYKNVQILAPMYAGMNGIDSLNKELQDIFNPKSEEKKEIKVGDIIYRENDKILQLVNMPDENVFNGDIGFISKIIPENISESKKNEIYVTYEFSCVKYLPKDLVKIKHGFVTSIHKAQGSEFELVIMPICTSYHRMLYKKLIYTGITRAKRKLIILGEPKAFLMGIGNENEYIRKTNLKKLLIDMYKKEDNA